MEQTSGDIPNEDLLVPFESETISWSASMDESQVISSHSEPLVLVDSDEEFQLNLGPAEVDEQESLLLSLGGLGEAPPKEPDLGGDFKPFQESKSLTSMGLVSIIEDTLDLDENDSDHLGEIEREFYYDLCSEYTDDLELETLKNNYLQRQMVEYCKKRRIEHALVADGVEEYKKRYYRLLDSLDELMEQSASQMDVKRKEVDGLRAQAAKKKIEVEEVFKKMLGLEAETAHGLMTVDETPHMQKAVERFLREQKYQMNLLIQMRLKYIKVRNKLTDKQNALNALDNLGPGLHLIDYEQLKVDNRNLHDKFEEKDNALIVLRVKVQNGMQTLAHGREKCAFVDRDLGVLQDEHNVVDAEFTSVRTIINELKIKRDNYRQAINKMNDRSGLLTRPKLLMDLQMVMEEIKDLEKKVDYYKEQYRTVEKDVKCIRHNMEIFKLRSAKGLSVEDDL